MQHIQCRWLGGLTLAACVLSVGFTPNQSRALRLVFTQTADEAALRSLAEEFFAAYAKRDLAGFVRLWSRKSPELAARKQSMQKLFADHEKIEVKSVAVSGVILEDDGARLRVNVEMSAVAKTGKPAAGLGSMKRILHCIKEDGRWQVRREIAAEEALAEALAAAKTEEERAALLAQEKELVTVDLRRALVTQGNRVRAQGRYPQALIIYLLAQRIAEQIGDQPGIAGVVSNIGNLYFWQGNYAQALEHYQKSLALREALGDKAGIASVLNNIGNVHLSKGNYAQALEYYQRSLPLREASGDKAGAADTGFNIGTIHRSRGDYTQALEQYQKSREVYEALGSKDGIATVLSGIGGIHILQGNYIEALEHYQKSLTLNEALGDKTGIADSLNDIGTIHNGQGNFTLALEYFQKSLEVYEALGSKAGMARALNGLGNIHRSRGNYAHALEHYQKSLALREALGDKDGIASVLNNIGIIHRSQGNYALASEYYQRSLALREASGDKAGTANALTNIANVSYSQNNYAQALEYHQKSLTLREALGDKAGIATSLHNIGSVYTKQGNYAQALEYCQKSLTLTEALGDKGKVAASALLSMGELHRLQANYTQALEFASRAMVLAEQTGDLDALWRAQASAGGSLRATNRPEQSRQSLADSIATVEALRDLVAGGEQEQQRFFEDKLGPYHAMVGLLTSQNQAGEALAYAERAKARVLLDVLRSGRVNITKAMTPQEQEQERRLNNQLVSLNTQISRENLRPQPSASRLNEFKARLQKARLDYEAFQTGLYATHPVLKAQRGEVQPLSLAEAGDLLPNAQSALLEFAVTDEGTFLFVLTKTRSGNQAPVELKVYSLEMKHKELADRAARFRESLAKRDLGFRQSARELYDLLLKPAQAQLQGKTSLVIVPDDALWELPFQTLQPAATRYLLEDYAISYAPSLTVLREMIRLRSKKAPTATGSSVLLAFGNPALGKQTIQRVKSVLMDEKLDPLPEAERQVNSLRQIYGPAQSKVYIGSEAREERAKTEAGNYRILHLATHGILNDRSPMYSHVLLAQAEGSATEDGMLEAWEILNLDLKADLAVLSACETARGRLGAGEGIIGLSWALFVAGCPTTVVSQWKVESSSTTELMVEFHKRLRGRLENGKTSTTKAEALREAALKLLRGKRSEYRHPFYWAGFVMVGEGL